MKRYITLAIVAVFILAGYVGSLVNHGVSRDVKLKSTSVRVELESTKLKKLELETQTLNRQLQEQLQKDETDNKTLQEYEQKIQEQDRKYKELEVSKANQRAERERIAQAASDAVNKVTLTGRASASSYTGGGNKEAWMAAAGIPQSDWAAVDSIVSRESGWNPCAYNPGRSDCNANPTSACGLAQSLPCGKQAKYGHWTDPVANLRWQHEYVTQRYGGYWQAVAFWNANHWY